MATNESSPKRRVRYEWTGEQIRALRTHMRLTQREMADELQVRQQTISEWETELHRPHRSTQKILTMIAEQAGFEYQVSPPDSSSSDVTEPS
jgi:DNA-binding transcriptional regulator YiaG